MAVEEIANDVVRQEYVAQNSAEAVASSNRKSKKKKKKKKEKSLDSTLGELSINTKSYNDQVLSEKVQPLRNDIHKSNKNNGRSSVLVIDPKFLKAENELRKIFGSKVVNSFENQHGVGTSRQTHGGRRAAYNLRKTILTSPSRFWSRWDNSLTMEHVEMKDGIHYFRYLFFPR